MLGAKMAMLVFAAVAILGVVGMLFVSPSQQGPQPEYLRNHQALTAQSKSAQAPTDQNAGPKAQESFWGRFLEFAASNDKAITALSTFAVAAFTFFLFIATILLWVAGERQRGLAQDTASRQLRAYVALQSGSVIHATVDTAPGFRVQVELKNSGLTPGYGFTTWIMPPEILPKDAVPFGPPRPLADRTGSSIIGPGSSAWINWYARFPEGDLDAVRKNTKAIFVWGGADYTDAFGKRRYFIFRDRIIGPENVPGGWALAPHKLGYDAN